MKRVLRKVAEAIAPGMVYERDLRRGAAGEGELRLLPALCPPGATALDIGANKGLYIAQLLKLTPKVIAFEPLPAMQAVLRRHYPNLRIEAVALSDHEGSAQLRLPRGNASWATLAQSNRLELSDTEIETVTTPLRTLDSYDFRGVGFVKIDVEGHEEAVLAGAAALLRREAPNVVVEVEERHNPGSPARIAAAMEAAGYGGWFLDDGQVRPWSEFSIERDQPKEAVSTRGKSGRYINNFVFTPRSREEETVAAMRARL